MQALCVMARRPGEVVSRDELVATCWAGRFVSDDAIQRAIAKLRRHAQDDAGNAFAIETVPRVGYRLVLTDEAPRVGSAAASERRSPRILAFGAAAIALALAAVVAVLSWANPSGSAHVATVQMTSFKAMGGDVPSDLPLKIFGDVRDAFGADNEVVIKDRGADFALHGQVRRVEDRYRYSVQLQDVRDGTLVWSASREWPVTASRMSREIAVTMTQTLRCGLKGAGEYRRRLPDHPLGLFIQFCEHGSLEHDVALARRIVAETPDFARGWSGLAFRTMMMTGNPALSPGGKQALQVEASRAAATAFKLDRRNAQIYETQSYLLPEGDRIGQERLLRRAAASNLTDCGCELMSYAAFMEETGRLGEANALYQRAFERQPLGLDPALRLAGSYDQIGQPALADQVFAKSAPIYGDNPGFQLAHARHLARAGEWNEDIEWVRRYSPPATRPVYLAAFAALQAGDPARIAAAAAAVEKRLRSNFDPGVVNLLLAMDDRDAVFSIAEAQIGQHPRFTEFLFSPGFVALRHDPRYERLMEAAGLIAHWRATRTRPDLCVTKDAPSFCQRL